MCTVVGVGLGPARAVPWPPLAVRQLWWEQGQAWGAASGQSSGCVLPTWTLSSAVPKAAAGALVCVPSPGLQGNYNNDLTESSSEKLLLGCREDCCWLSSSAFHQEIRVEIEIQQQRVALKCFRPAWPHNNLLKSPSCVQERPSGHPDAITQSSCEHKWFWVTQQHQVPLLHLVL